MILCYVTDGRGRQDRLNWLLERIRRAALDGVDYIQIREKELTARQLCDLCCGAIDAVSRVNSRRTKILINDRLDVALACGADGVHLPASGLPIESARKAAPGLFISKSCHSVGEVRMAISAGAALCLLGPIYSTPSKPPGTRWLGPGVFEQLRDAPIPVLAIGGITEERASECVRAGAAGIAAIRLFQDESVTENDSPRTLRS